MFYLPGSHHGSVKLTVYPRLDPNLQSSSSSLTSAGVTDMFHIWLGWVFFKDEIVCLKIWSSFLAEELSEYGHVVLWPWALITPYSWWKYPCWCQGSWYTGREGVVSLYLLSGHTPQWVNDGFFPVPHPRVSTATYQYHRARARYLILDIVDPHQQ